MHPTYQPASLHIVHRDHHFNKNAFKTSIPLLLIQKASQKLRIHKRKIFFGSPIYKSNPSNTAALYQQEPKATDIITGRHWLRSHKNLDSE